MSFSALGLESQLTSNLSYTTPTPIQEQTIPLILEGKDILGLAQTGTGKTAAFALPIIQKLKGSKSRHVKALIVAPTRELATQLKDSFAKYSEGTNLISMAIFGGVPLDRQIKRLKNGVDIVIGCPGRILDLVKRGALKLNGVECLVLDEADQMFDMGFLPDIKRIVAAVPKERQTLLFSATMPSEIDGLAQQVLKNPETIKISNQKPSSTIKQTLFEVSADKKSELLIKLATDHSINTAIVFARTKHRVQSLAKSLAKSGFEVAELQGNLSHMRRKKAIEGFKEGRFQFLVATDLASRGLDISELDFVINYDIPLTPDAYVHRIGRTGRATREGQAFTFVSRPDEKMVRIIEKVLGNKIDRQAVEGFNQPEARSEGRTTRKPRSFSGERSSASRAPAGERDRSERRPARDSSETSERSFDRKPSADRKPFSDRRDDSRRDDRRNSDSPRSFSRDSRPARSNDGFSKPQWEGPRNADRNDSRDRKPAFRQERPAGFRKSFDNRDERPAFNRDERPAFNRDRRPDSDRAERTGTGREFKRSEGFSSERKPFRKDSTESRSYNSDRKPYGMKRDAGFSKDAGFRKDSGFNRDAGARKDSGFRKESGFNKDSRNDSGFKGSGFRRDSGAGRPAGRGSFQKRPSTGGRPSFNRSRRPSEA